MAGASRTTFSRAQTQSKAIDTKPQTVMLLVAPTERGPIGVSVPVSSFPEWEKVFGGATANTQDTYLEVKALFEEAGQKGAPLVNFTRTVHCSTPGDPTTKTSAAATLALLTAAVSATSGFILAAVGPYNLANGDTIKLKIDGGGLQTFTLAATAAARTAANTGPYVLANGNTLAISIDGVALPSLVFTTSMFANIAAATTAEVVAAINAHLAANSAGAVADNNSNAPRITSNRKGTGSIVQVTGGTANAALGFNTAAVNGTGDASNIAATTAAELVTKLAGLTGAVPSAPGGAFKVTSSTTGGTSSVQLDSSSSTTTKLGLDNAIHSGVTAGTQSTLRVDGLSDGTYANALSTEIVLPGSNGASNSFDLYVLKGGVAIERFFSLDLDPTSARYAPKVVNEGGVGQSPSNLIKLTDLGSTLASPENLPAAGTFGPLTGGNDGLAGLVDADFTGAITTNGRTGLRIFDTIDGAALVGAPGRATATMHNGLINYCEGVRGGGCFTVLDTPKGLSGDQMITYVVQTAGLKQLSEMAAIYWPCIYVDNPNTAVFGNDATVLTGPMGSIMGLCARIDQSKDGGAFEHPASIEIGFLTTARGLETEEVKDDGVRGRVFDALVNPIMQKRGTPIYVDGARTLKDNGPFPTVGESRGALFVQLQLGPELDPKRNRNIRPRLYSEAKARVEAFMHRLTVAECFASLKDEEAWYFDIGTALNPTSEQKARNVNARLGMATTAPAEFINVVIAPFTPAAAA